MSDRATELHRNPWTGVYFITGGGSELIAELLTTPGASRSVLEVTVPYAHTSLNSMLGKAPDQACSEPTARAMAMAAFERARELATDDQNAARLFGLGCTASLATDREKRGRHRAHIALQTESATYSRSLELAGSRAKEETLLLDALWSLLNQALGDKGTTSENAEVTVADARWKAVLLGNEAAISTLPHDGSLLLSGSFNPLHRGHVRMLDVAEDVTGRPGAFEMSIVNVDKPPLDYAEISTRLGQFKPPVWLTRLPTFVEKARQFPGAVFAVGVDTIVRIDATRYCESRAARDTAMEELAALGCAFLVFGRKEAKKFLQLGDLQLSETLTHICQEVPADRFRLDISSTQLRRP